MKKIVLTFGLIAGAIMSAMLVAAIPLKDNLDFDKGAVVGYTTMVLAFLMVYFGVRTYRDNVAGGTITFGRAFKVGLLISLVASACYVATWQVVYYKFLPDSGQKYVAYELEKARKAGAPEAKLAEMKAEMDKFLVMYQNPFFNVAITFIEPLPVGIVFTLGSAWFLSRRRKEAVA
ncbi:MAG: DUF4199 domain-containing protein [Betaproteobacteria bacterium]|nr:DUF4199 domain-containing protein [Betaproteobacteria bacterium]